MAKSIVGGQRGELTTDHVIDENLENCILDTNLLECLINSMMYHKRVSAEG